MPGPVIAVRVATTPSIGRGHVSRCAAVRAHMAGPVRWFLDDKGGLGTGGRADDGITRETGPDRADILLGAVAHGEVSTVMVDSYALTEATLADLCARARCLVWRDGFPYPPTAMVVDPQPGATSERPDDLIGPAYLPLQPAILPWRGDTAPAWEAPLRVLVAFGAVDTADRTGLALKALAEASRRHHLAITCVLGSEAPHRISVAARIDALDRAVLNLDTDDMGALYATHHLAIGAPGVSQAERAYCGLPTLLVPQNAAQETLATAWAEAGAAVSAPPEATVIADALEQLLVEPTPAHRLRATGLSLVDGKGAHRVARALMDLSR